MYTNKLVPGQKLPVIKKALVGAGEVELGATDGVKHKLLVVYRGQVRVPLSMTCTHLPTSVS